MSPLRRQLLLTAAATLPAAATRAAAATSAVVASDAATSYAPLVPQPLEFPRDHGAHPQTRLEWWYFTAHLDAPGANAGSGFQRSAIGIQLTFFRMRTGISPDNPSRFAAHQLVLAHAAIADPAVGALLHDERLAREGFDVAQARTGDTHVGVDHWRLDREAAGDRYTGNAHATGFALDVTATPTQAILLQGERGYSRKGGGAAASFYYSEPQLDVRARLVVAGRSEDRSGTGWLDHEWSNSLLPPRAAGWEWGGYNLADGSALTVFRIRARSGAAGGQTLHAYACLRAPGREAQHYAPAQIGFTPLEYWISPRTRARYPVAQQLRIGTRTFETRPLMPDQEYAAHAAGAVVYWEGASALYEGGRPVGRGYLELTGYDGAAPGATLGG